MKIAQTIFLVPIQQHLRNSMEDSLNVLNYLHNVLLNFWYFKGERSMTKINFFMTVKSKGISVSWLIWSYVNDDKEAQGKSILLRWIIHFWCRSKSDTDVYRLKWEAAYFISSCKCWDSNPGWSGFKTTCTESITLPNHLRKMSLMDNPPKNHE